MHSTPQHVHTDHLRVYKYSLDWRFLLPMGDTGQIRVVADDDPELMQALECVGISTFNLFSTRDVRQMDTKVGSLALPFGLPTRWVGPNARDHYEFFRTLQHFVDPRGYLLVGFNNAWNFRPSTPGKYYSSTPGQISGHLQRAGFKAIKLFGAFPNLDIPEYIFDLNTQAIRFSLSHRFRRKSVLLKSLYWSSRIMSWSSLTAFLPCYYAVAAV